MTLHRAGPWFELGWEAGYLYRPGRPRPDPPKGARSRQRAQWHRGFLDGLDSRRIFEQVRREKVRLIVAQQERESARFFRALGIR